MTNNPKLSFKNTIIFLIFNFALTGSFFHFAAGKNIESSHTKINKSKSTKLNVKSKSKIKSSSHILANKELKTRTNKSSSKAKILVVGKNPSEKDFNLESNKNNLNKIKSHESSNKIKKTNKTNYKNIPSQNLFALRKNKKSNLGTSSIANDSNDSKDISFKLSPKSSKNVFDATKEREFKTNDVPSTHLNKSKHVTNNMASDDYSPDLLARNSTEVKISDEEARLLTVSPKQNAIRNRLNNVAIRISN